MVDLPHPHDALFKLVFSQPEHAAGELRAVLPPAVAERIAWDTLTHRPGSFVDETLAQAHTDLLFSATLDGRVALIYFLFEHLSTEAPLAAFRLLSYEVRIWDDWLAKNPGAKKLPPIVPVVLHHSEAGWRGGTEFEALLDVPDELRPEVYPFVPRFRFILDDVSKATDDALRQRAMTSLGTIALWCFRDARKPGVLLRDLRRYFDLLFEVRRAPNGVAAARAILRYIAVTTTKVDQEQFNETLRYLAAPIEGTMETLADQLEEYFMDKGIARGRREMLLRQLRKRFGELPESVSARVTAAEVPTLDLWADRVLTAATLDEVFAES